MTAGQFVDIVAKMRTAQKSYFRTRSQKSLEKSKELEKTVDDILAKREAMKILKSKDFSFSLEEPEENQFCFSKVLSPKESYACLCFIAKIRHEENMEQGLKKIIDVLAKNAEEDSEQP